MSRRYKYSLKELQTLLAASPAAFATPLMRQRLDELMEQAYAVQCAQRKLHQAEIIWEFIPEAEKYIALCRSRVARLVRICVRERERNDEAVRAEDFWLSESILRVAAMGELSLKEFRQISPEFAKDDWVALRRLNISNEFNSMRSIQMWLFADDEYLFDAMWFTPLHLVDKDVIKQVAPIYQPKASGVSI